MLDAFFYPFADDIERTFQVGCIAGSGDEYLLDIRFGGQSVFTQNRRVDRYITQMHQCQSFTFDFFDKDAQDVFLFFLVFG